MEKKSEIFIRNLTQDMNCDLFLVYKLAPLFLAFANILFIFP